jgi:hypothetical protein
MATHVSKIMSIAAIMRSPQFTRGFREGLAGAPMDFTSCGSDGVELWLYERGRIFSHIYKGPLKDGRSIHVDAMSAFRTAARIGAILR